MTGMNWLDAVIILFLFISMLQGIRVGLIKSIFTIAGLAAGLTAAVRFYAPGGSLLRSQVNLPLLVADMVSFIAIFLAVFFAVTVVRSLAAHLTRFKLIQTADKIGGIAAGLVIGLAIIGTVLILLTSFPLIDGFQTLVAESYLAPSIIDAVHTFYDFLADMLPLNLPQLAFHPEDLAGHLNNIQVYPAQHAAAFRQLDGATCFVCGSAVQFLGFLENVLGAISPKFRCTNCDRTSDGCQTYEGYHLMYENCPVVLGRAGYRFDCGVWPNHSFHRPTAPCPVCGEAN
ncbi:MAG TPA: CvpA family protein [Candidatus Limnocylindrales bacterium]|nr:CvpA family protein [Candidatus Limnocylindrales bacterium]